MSLPRVSVVVPCRNEVHRIRRCLEGLLAGAYPLGSLEILVVDGMSDDGTQAVVKEVAAEHPVVRLLHNPKSHAGPAMNLGIREATGDIVIRFDAHAEPPPGYIARCVRVLQESGADNVGGPCRTLPGGDGVVAKGIAAAMSHRFGVGNARFRTSREAGDVDTVPFGVFRREIFEVVGLFDEELVRNQDDELNYRIVRRGGRVYMDPRLESAYYARATLQQAWRQYFEYGFWKVRVIQKHGKPASWRHVVPAVFAGSVCGLPVVGLVSPLAMGIWVGIVGAYGAAAGGVALANLRRLGWRVAGILPVAFFVLHVGYGFGFLKGLFEFGIRRAVRKGAA